MSLISTLLRSGYGRSHTEELSGGRSSAPVAISVEKERDGVRAHRLAGEAESTIANVEALLVKAGNAGLSTTNSRQQIGFARTNLAAARQKIQCRELSDACAWAQTALNQASLAREWINDLIAKRLALAMLCQGLGKKLSGLRYRIPVSLALGKAIRANLLPEKHPPQEWRALRWLDQAAEMRVKEAEALLGELGARLDRGELDEIEWNAERVKAWIDQATGYLDALAALENFLITRNEHVADKATTAYTLMSSVYAVFYKRVSSGIMGWADEASNAYAGVKGPEDIKAHDEVLIKSLAVVSAIENNLLETAARRFGKRQTQGQRDLTSWTAAEFGRRAYYDLAVTDHAQMLVDLFPRRLSPGEQANRDTSWCSDGPCTCH
jgi:hypothetical protein